MLHYFSVAIVMLTMLTSHSYSIDSISKTMSVYTLKRLQNSPVKSSDRYRYRNTQRSAFTSQLNAVVNNMKVEEFAAILQSTSRADYQIIDVREADELKDISLVGDDIIHLPLSGAEAWSSKVTQGSLLDNSKPTLCMCKLGGRSMKVATFLGEFRSQWQLYIYTQSLQVIYCICLLIDKSCIVGVAALLM